MHPDNVPDRLKDQYRSMCENAVGVPIISQEVINNFNKKSASEPTALKPQHRNNHELWTTVTKQFRGYRCKSL